MLNEGVSNKLTHYVEKDLIFQIITETYDMYKNILKTIPDTCSSSELAKTTCETIDRWLRTYNDSLVIRLGLSEKNNEI